MSFSVDKQTLEDLNLLGKYRVNSIFNLFNRTRTRGGERLLESMFQHPLTDAGAINHRSDIFRYFQLKNVEFPFSDTLFEEVEHYFSTLGHSNRMIAAINTCRWKFMGYIGADKEYETICSGLLAAIGFMNVLEMFNDRLAAGGDKGVFSETLTELREILHDKRLCGILEMKGRGRLSLAEVVKYDHLLRYVCLEKMERMMQLVYECDVYIAVAKVAAGRKFVYAKALAASDGKSRVAMRNVFHPGLTGAVGNSVGVDEACNVIFLTGANMAGKSTFMKSFSIAIYLAQMGFPVAAEEMEFSVQDGLYTSINVADNLNMGHSHFYAEVLRVKHIAEEVSRGKNLVVVFDELFKGTNVKDAYDATVAVTEAFAEHRNCSFMISTHIIEAGQTLRERCANFKFVYLPTLMKGTVPAYTYKLQEGITNDRHGMMIITNEHIVDIIKKGKV